LFCISWPCSLQFNHGLLCLLFAGQVLPSMISMITSCSNYYIFAKLYQDAKISLKIPKGVIRSHKSKDRHVIQWPEEKRTMI
jgi:hypothetical protein